MESIVGWSGTAFKWKYIAFENRNDTRIAGIETHIYRNIILYIAPSEYFMKDSLYTASSSVAVQVAGKVNMDGFSCKCRSQRTESHSVVIVDAKFSDLGS